VSERERSSFVEHAVSTLTEVSLASGFDASWLSADIEQTPSRCIQSLRSQGFDRTRRTREGTMKTELHTTMKTHNMTTSRLD